MPNLASQKILLLGPPCNGTLHDNYLIYWRSYLISYPVFPQLSSSGPMAIMRLILQSFAIGTGLALVVNIRHLFIQRALIEQYYFKIYFTWSYCLQLLFGRLQYKPSYGATNIHMLFTYSCIL